MRHTRTTDKRKILYAEVEKAFLLVEKAFLLVGVRSFSFFYVLQYIGRHVTMYCKREHASLKLFLLLEHA
jgi:hypothetical protein